MRAVLIANGWLTQPVELLPGDILIAADGGARHCLKFGLIPAYVVGDMDSLNDQDIAMLQEQGCQFIRYPSRKDYTDLELAMMHAQELGASEILVLAALGARWDQTLANLLLPAALAPAHIRIIDGNQEIAYLHGGESISIHGHPGDTVSLIPLAGDASGITTQGLEYSLNQEDLVFGSTRGISNMMLGEEATIDLKEGLMLCTTIHR
ncbi:MAG: thiamine diphosphokinase [Anaerolineales bacterium]|nr:thiamine diphosphokinase [Anaerolineales bacterium]